MDVFNPGIKWYADKINDGERFSFVRYGNGEWDLVLGRGTRTGSGSQVFSDDLREAMRATLAQPREGAYYTGMQSTSYLTRKGLLGPAEGWLASSGVKRRWHNADVFHKASKHKRLYPLIEALRQQRVVIVGPPWLMQLTLASVFVPVRKHNCWQDVDKIEGELRGLSDVVVSFSAGPAAKVLIHRLHPVIGDSCWLLDLGSLWDPYCGKQSRSYHRHITRDVIRRNLRGK